MEKIFYGRTRRSLCPEGDAAVGAMQHTCRGIIESRGTLFSIINRKIPGRKKGLTTMPHCYPYVTLRLNLLSRISRDAKYSWAIAVSSGCSGMHSG